MDLTDLSKTLYHEIPLTQHLGIKAESYDGKSLIISAPLAPNRNHKSTAFGGSLYSVAVTCGWALLYIQLKEWALPGQVVIYKSEMRYSHPVDQDFTASCQKPDILVDETFSQRLQRKRIASITLPVEIAINGEVKSTFTGKYVISMRHIDVT